MTAGTPAPPQLGAQFVNYGSGASGVPDVVFVAQDTTTNKIDLVLSIDAGSSMLVAGDVVAPEQLPPTGDQTLLYLDLSALGLTDAAWQSLAPNAKGWNCKVFAGDQVVGLAPSASGTVLASGSPIAIHLEKLELDKAPSSPQPQLSVTYFNVPGVTTGNVSREAPFGVVAQNPPSGKADLTKDLAVSLVSNVVVNSVGAKRTLENTLTLEFARTSSGLAARAGPDTVFTVGFVYGNAKDPQGYGALTDVDHAKLIVPVKGDNVDKWVATPYLQAESPYWTLQPQDRMPIAGTGASAVSSWNFTNVATPYQAGPTVMLISYTGVPDYEDGAYSLVLNKVAHVVINGFSVDPNPTYLHDGKAKVDVRWDVEYATKLVLTQNFDQRDVTDYPTGLPVDLAALTTAFTLTADGPGADVDNSDYANTLAIALPVINSFRGAPTEIYSGSGQHDVDLFWAVDTTGKVALTSSSGQTGGTFGATDGTSLTVAKPQMLTVAPVTEPGVVAPSRNLVVGGFAPTTATHAAGAATSGAAASPSAPFVAVVDPAGKRVIALDTVQFSEITSVGVGAAPVGVVFSPDGSLMVTLNGDSTASLHEVALTAGVPSFTPLPTLALSGNPRDAVVTPDGNTMYLSVDGTPGSLVVATKDASGYAVKAHVVVGNAPRGLAAAPSGANLYVANSADDTVSVIGVGIDGTLKVLDPIRLTTAGQKTKVQPSGVAVTADGATLLVACTAVDAVWAIETRYPNTGSRQELGVGAKPVDVALTPSGAYAFVANSGDGSVSLLDVWTGPPGCAVLKQSIALGTSPSGVAVSPDGLVVLVSDSGSTNIGVISLQIYEVAAVAGQVGNAPTDVVSSPDATAALVWNDALIGGRQPVPGVRYYSVAAQVATEILSDILMVECVFVPSAGGKKSQRAYAVGNVEPLLYDVDLTDPKNPVETDVTLPGRVLTRGLGISGDGNTLFVVTADSKHAYSLLIGSVSNGAWTTSQSLPLYTGQWAGPVRVAVTPDASTLFIADLANHQFTTAVRGKDGAYALSPTQLTVAGASSVAILPDGATAYVLAAVSPNSITVVDVATLKTRLVSVLQPYVNLRQLTASPDGRRLFAADLSAAALRILDPGSLRILQTIPLAPNVGQAQGASSIAVAPDGSFIFVTNTGSSTLSVLQQNPI